MPTRRHYVNGAPTLTTASTITNSATSVTSSTTFAGYPVSFPYLACLEKGTANQEIVLVTNVVGSTATITRAQDGTAAVGHLAGSTIDFVAAAIDFDEANAHTSASAGVHGVAGNVVGDADVQTLTNKTLAAPAATGSLASFGGAWSTYTPTLTATTTNPTLGTGSTQYGHYVQVGKTVAATVFIKFGSSGTAAGIGFYLVGLPVTPVTTTMGSSLYRIGSGRIQCAGLWTFVDITADGHLHYSGAASGGAQHDVSESAPGSWTTNDYIMLDLRYEAA